MGTVSFNKLAKFGLVFIVISFIGCDGHTTISGHVLDEDGAAIPGATVNLADGKYPVGIESTSEADGTFFVGGTHSPHSDTVNLTVEKDGYNSTEQSIECGKQHSGVKITCIDS
jgi:hypothetical protein